MKRLFFICCLIFMSMNTMACDSVLVEGRVWCFENYQDTDPCCDDEPEFIGFSYYKVNGDSIINGENYKKIYFSYDSIDWVLEYLIWEDIKNKKLWNHIRGKKVFFKEIKEKKKNSEILKNIDLNSLEIKANPPFAKGEMQNKKKNKPKKKKKRFCLLKY